MSALRAAIEADSRSVARGEVPA